MPTGEVVSQHVMNGHVQIYRAEPAMVARSEHAEGPCWDARTGQLLWVDQYAGLVILADYDGDTRRLTPVRTYSLGHPVGAVVPASDGGWMTAVRHGFAQLGLDGAITWLAQPEDGSAVRMRMNDGKCDAAGRFWAGSMAFDKLPGAGSLYRLDPDLQLTTVLRGPTISNGLAWSADGTTMFYIDTPTRRIDRFTVTPDGELAARTTAVSIPPGAGEPDGMCIDDDGALWVALWGGAAVHRYAPTGELLAIVEIDAPQVSSCCFGGPDGRTLFVTTSQEGFGAAERAAHPESGKLFCVQVDVSGRPAAAFGSSPG